MITVDSSSQSTNRPATIAITRDRIRLPQPELAPCQPPWSRPGLYA